VASTRVVEPLDVIKNVGFGLSFVRYTLRAVRSVFMLLKKLSIAALSQTLPDRLMLQVTR
jgi:hypothetical protein